MWRAVLAAAMLLLAANAAEAQWGSSSYGRGGYYAPSQNFFGFWGWNDSYRPRGPAFQSGGERPDITPIEPKLIAFPSQYPVNSVVIDTKGRQLLLIKSE